MQPVNKVVLHKVFFLGSLFLPVVTEINGYREISKISAIYRPS
jgi:hypothetical protein